MSSPTVTSKKQQLARLARKQRFAAAVYFATGVFPPLPNPPRFQTSSATITPSTIFVSRQKG